MLVLDVDPSTNPVGITADELVQAGQLLRRYEDGSDIVPEVGIVGLDRETALETVDADPLLSSGVAGVDVLRGVAHAQLQLERRAHVALAAEDAIIDQVSLWPLGRPSYKLMVATIFGKEADLISLVKFDAEARSAEVGRLVIASGRTPEVHEKFDPDFFTYSYALVGT